MIAIAAATAQSPATSPVQTDLALPESAPLSIESFIAQCRPAGMTVGFNGVGVAVNKDSSQVELSVSVFLARSSPASFCVDSAAELLPIAERIARECLQVRASPPQRLRLDAPHAGTIALVVCTGRYTGRSLSATTSAVRAANIARRATLLIVVLTAAEIEVSQSFLPSTIGHTAGLLSVQIPSMRQVRAAKDLRQH